MILETTVIKCFLTNNKKIIPTTVVVVVAVAVLMVLLVKENKIILWRGTLINKGKPPHSHANLAIYCNHK
jgi:hypothetical protein